MAQTKRVSTQMEIWREDAEKEVIITVLANYAPGTLSPYSNRLEYTPSEPADIEILEARDAQGVEFLLSDEEEERAMLQITAENEK